jgi:alanine dehydrogenase
VIVGIPREIKDNDYRVAATPELEHQPLSAVIPSAPD